MAGELPPMDFPFDVYQETQVKNPQGPSEALLLNIEVYIDNYAARDH